MNNVKTNMNFWGCMLMSNFADGWAKWAWLGLAGATVMLSFFSKND